MRGLIDTIITSQDGSVLNFLNFNFKVLIKHIFNMSDAHLINLIQRSGFFIEVKLIGLHTGLGNQATKSFGNHFRILIQIMDLVINSNGNYIWFDILSGKLFLFRPVLLSGIFKKILIY